MPTFGSIVAQTRKKAGLSQKDLAARITKEDGKAISAQYLNDIEHDRRNPSSQFLIHRLAAELRLPKDYLMLAAGALPEDGVKDVASAGPERVADAYKAFRRKIQGK